MAPRRRHFGPRRSSSACRGFTLLELLVAIVILLILTGLTVAVVNATLDGDRLRGASRQVQSYLEGARDRAIYAGEPRGVRFQLDPNDPSAVNSMVFIGPPEDFSDGSIAIQADFRSIGLPAGWDQLRNRGLLVDGSRITIYQPGSPNTVLTRSTIAFDQAAGQWKLTRNAPSSGPNHPYDLELAPAVLANQEPRLLPQGVVIDLDESELPDGWGSAAPYSPRLDVLFSPRGTVIGDVASAGHIHFMLANLADTARNIPVARAWQANNAYAIGDWVVPNPLNFIAFECVQAGTSDMATEPIWPTTVDTTLIMDGTVQWLPQEKGQNLIVSLATQTGKVSTHSIWDNRPLTTDPLDPFRYAETGEVAK